MTPKHGNNQRLRIQNVNENVSHSGFLNKEGLCISSLPDQRFQETVGFTLKHFANKLYQFYPKNSRAEDQYIKPGLLKDRKKNNFCQQKAVLWCLRGLVVVSKRLLRRGNEDKRFRRAKRYQSFTVDDWKESEIYGSNGRVHVSRTPAQN